MDLGTVNKNIQAGHSKTYATYFGGDNQENLEADDEAAISESSC